MFFNLYFEFGEVRRCYAAAGEGGQGRDESLCPDGNGWERRNGVRMCYYEMVGVKQLCVFSNRFFFLNMATKM